MMKRAFASPFPVAARQCAKLRLRRSTAAAVAAAGRVALRGARAARNAMIGALLICGATGHAWGHGGQYRGPGGGVPGGPGFPGPGGPATPGGGPSTGGEGASSDWQSWWEFNKDPFLNLKEAVHAVAAITGSDEFYMGGSRQARGQDTLKPAHDQIVDEILPALKRALAATEQRDIVTACLIAMAKIGLDGADLKILDAMRPHLSSRDQEIRETAALAMGISQMPAAVADLVALATDSQAGRKLCGRSQVDDRTRAFACYGLGLISYANEDAACKRQCFDALASVLAATTERLADRNVPVAAINGIRLIAPGPDNAELLDACLERLWLYYTRKAGQGDQQVQAHVAPAIAQLLGRGSSRAAKYKEAFAAELANEGANRSNAILQSAAIALGVLCDAPEAVEGDAPYSKVLLDYATKGKDEQTRWFCLISLAKIGGKRNRDELMLAYQRGNKALVKPWAALALGVLEFHAQRRGGSEADSQIGRALRDDLRTLKNVQTQSALAVALGLCRFRDAAVDLELLLAENKHQDEFAGYLCIGLALMESRRSIDLIRGIAAGALRRPELLRQAAIALGKLGDKSVTELLQTMLTEPPLNVAKLGAISSALGFIGDRRTIAPLIGMLHDEALTPLSRAFAAVALGGVADKEPLPWNSKIAVDSSYQASVETLTNGTSGILDIL